tara:strand:- start:14 stop:358 length:345 start_codon:yes stop_codon:yes gene_type:complete
MKRQMRMAKSAPPGGGLTMLAQLLMLALFSFSIMWLIGGREQQPWIPYAWGTTLFAFVAVRVPVMMKHWKTIYKQALKDQGYHAAVERLGGEVPKTGRLKGAERKKAQKASKSS